MNDELGMERENRRRARMGFRDETGPWYALDNAAIIMPANSDTIETGLFRLSADLDENVRLPELQGALDQVCRRFPYFAVDLRRGFFWHYLEPHRGRVMVQSDAESPCQGFDMHWSGTCLFRVRAKGSRVAVEFAHILTDATGGIRFLKNLVVEYFRRRGIHPGPEIGSDRDLRDLDGPIDPEELEDAYNRSFPGGYPHPPKEAPAFHIDSRLLAPGDYRVTRLSLSLTAALAVAKSFACSLSELLVAVYLEALQEIWLATPARRRKGRSRLSIEVPVNMRRFYPTATMRNFSLFVHVEQDMLLGRRQFADIAERVHHLMRLEVDRSAMTRHISRNVRGGRLLPLRLIPLLLKAPLMRFLYSLYGDNIISGVLSNIGPVILPPAFAARVRRLDFIHAPSRRARTKISVLSYADTLSIGFGSLARSREVERLFASGLRALGLDLLAESNM
jgi:hypothetical protein